jgi:hypothetical protein
MAAAAARNDERERTDESCEVDRARLSTHTHRPYDNGGLLASSGTSRQEQASGGARGDEASVQ